MREVTFLEAIRLAMWEEMERDPNVFMIGEDIGRMGGAFGVDDRVPGAVRSRPRD
jgi:pyruvate/2-oxoglutarate/acetoin dehydrogenase E1 component